MIPMDYAVRCDVKPPTSRKEAYDFAGWDPAIHLGYDGRPLPVWEATNIQRLVIPKPLKLSYADVSVTRVAVHRKAAPSLFKALVEIDNAGLWEFLSPFGGGFEFRRIGGSDELSLHSLGLALDFDPKANARDLPADQSRFGRSGEGRAVVRLFELHGWYWGGRFKAPSRPDAMHFQFATGT